MNTGQQCDPSNFGNYPRSGWGENLFEGYAK